MTEPAAAEPVPLRVDSDGVIRVGGTRVTLDTVVAAFEAGATPEQIAQDYPVGLADLYAVITYYLRHPEEIREYRERRSAAADSAREAARARWHQGDLRQQLQRRLAGRSG